MPKNVSVRPWQQHVCARACVSKLNVCACVRVKEGGVCARACRRSPSKSQLGLIGEAYQNTFSFLAAKRRAA